MKWIAYLFMFVIFLFEIVLYINSGLSLPLFLSGCALGCLIVMIIVGLGGK